MGSAFTPTFNLSANVAEFLLPTGVTLEYGGSTAPAGFLMCDGSAVSRTTYATLFGVIGTTFGVGDGSTTFNVPDHKGRVVAGKESSETRITTAVAGFTGATLGAAGGDQNLASHTHAQQGSSAIGGGAVDFCTVASNNSGATSGRFTTAAAGTGSSGNVQPTIIMNKIIKT